MYVATISKYRSLPAVLMNFLLIQLFMHLKYKVAKDIVLIMTFEIFCPIFPIFDNIWLHYFLI